MRVSRRVLVAGAAATLFGAGYATASWRETLAAARRRTALRSSMIQTRSGAIEYAVAGRGEPFLMVHGTGGGFDQGLRFAHGLIERGLRVIAPSRFGYLRSDLPPDPSPARQADAFADLLDDLGIDALPVAGGSAGALPAAQFALRHPERCTHLILLVPAVNLSGRDPVEFSPLQRVLVDRLLGSDLWFWALLRIAPETLVGTLLATDPRLLAQVSPEERLRAELILEELMPITRRAAGMRNDGHYSGSPAEIDVSAISRPLLVVSAEDDRFGTAATARTIAAALPTARLIIYPTGGHIWLGRDAEVCDEILRFLATGAGI